MKVELNNEQIDKLVKEALVEAYHDYTSLPIYNVPEEDDELLYCLKRVIEHYSSPEEYDNWTKSIEKIGRPKKDG